MSQSCKVALQDWLETLSIIIRAHRENALVCRLPTSEAISQSRFGNDTCIVHNERDIKLFAAGLNSGAESGW